MGELYALTKKISAPFNGDVKNVYKNLLPKYGHVIKEIYFPLPSAIASNARSNGQATTLEELALLLDAVSSYEVDSAVVLNSSWMPLEAYTDDYLKRVINAIGVLYRMGLKKIIIKNNYYMRTNVFRDLFPNLKLESSINCMYDTIPKVIQALEMFRYDSVIIDRSFNNNHVEFTKLKLLLAELNVETKMLVNEGCLYDCPFKQDHDNMLGMCSYGGAMFDKYKQAYVEANPDNTNPAGNVNYQYGCVSVYRDEPWKFLKSPFIRPEDVHLYERGVQLIKIAGRTQSNEWIDRVIGAYAAGSYDGDIRDLTDTGPLDGSFPNKKLDERWEFVAHCNKVCTQCTRCKTLYEEINREEDQDVNTVHSLV